MEQPIQFGSGRLLLNAFNGQLTRMLLAGRYDLIHGAGNPAEFQTEADKARISNGAWNNSGLEFFPLIGKPKYGQFEEDICGQIFPMDQHGLSRHINWELIDARPEYASFQQFYTGFDLVANTKAKPGSPNPQHLAMPNGFKIVKELKVDGTDVKIEYTIMNISDRELFYEFGTHPAFTAPQDYSKAVFTSEKESSTLADIVRKDGNVQIFRDCDRLHYRNEETGIGIEMTSDLAGHAMVWTPGANAGMLCIEPITNMPRHGLGHAGNRKLKPYDAGKYSVGLKITGA